MKTFTLKSGKELRIQPAKFRAAKNLFDAVVKELKSAKIEMTTELDANFMKDCLLSVISSESVEKAIWPCMADCLYENTRISESTFDDPSAREDFFEICFEVGKENLLPFGKNLYAEFGPVLASLGLSPQ